MTRRHELIGLVYVLAIALLVWLAIASYQHVFTDHVTVTVQARTAGQQLNVGGDVRMNGAIVGRVSGVDTQGSGAEVRLQIDSDDARRIPTDVAARILPTTLFGQKYVELHSTTSAAGGHLRDGDRIPEDRSATATELTDVVDDLDGVLTAVHPDRLAAALGGLAEGLSGRGESLARLIDTGGTYLGALNAQTPVFEQDLRLLRTVTGQYADVTPDLLASARNATTTARTLTRQPDTIAAFIAALDGTAVAGNELVADNADALAESAKLARPTSELLAEYSPELLCTLRGFLAVEAQSAKQIRHGKFQGHFTVGAQARGYTPADALVLGDLGTGPACRGLPNAPIPYGAVNLDDGAGDTSLLGMLTGGKG